MLLNGGFKNSVFNQAREDIPGYLVSDNSSPGDQDMTFAAVKAAQGYDYAIRCDQDAFPSVEAFSRMARFLETNAVDILSPAGSKQKINPGPDSMNTPLFYPWKQPTPGDEIVFMKKSFMDKAFDNFSSIEGLIDPDISENLFQRPYCLNTLTYQSICNLMQQPMLEPEFATTIPRVDGQLGTNIFTSMCLSGLKQAEIRDQGKSFECKVKLTEYNSKVSWIDRKDNPDTSIQELPGVDAPFFHLGWSYLTSLHLCPGQHPYIQNNLRDNLWKENFLKNDNSWGMWATHNAVIGLLVRIHGTAEMKRNYEAALHFLTHINPKVDLVKFKQYRTEVEEYFKPALADYL